jgi:hypothetical protein
MITSYITQQPLYGRQPVCSLRSRNNSLRRWRTRHTSVFCSLRMQAEVQSGIFSDAGTMRAVRVNFFNSEHKVHIDAPVVLLASRYGGALEQLPNSLEQYAQLVKDAELATSEEAPHEPSYTILSALGEARDGELPDGIIWEKYRVPPSYHNRYDRMQALPANFAVLGDAFIRLNPSFGQGCSKASHDVLTLDAFLRNIHNDQEMVTKHFAVNLMKKLSRQNRGLFDLSRLNGMFYSS